MRHSAHAVLTQIDVSGTLMCLPFAAVPASALNAEGDRIAAVAVVVVVA
ncbi:hypothetical protein [Xanthomonas sp. LMC-A-07]|nr:hypothetical protein [Xanthomonas sp. LMC-A-07]